VDAATLFALARDSRTQRAEGQAMKVKVEGAAAKIDVMFRFNKELWRDMQRDVKTATEAVAADARSRVPSAGIGSRRSGYRGWGPWTSRGRMLSFEQGEVRAGIKNKFQSRQLQGFRQVAGRVDMTSPAGAIFALAGSRNRSGHPFNTTVNRQHGGIVGARSNQMWPRVLTPARYAKGGEAAKKIAEAVERGIDAINRA
jgi:hypothetical protein